MDGDPNKRPTSLEIVETIRAQVQMNVEVKPGESMSTNFIKKFALSKVSSNECNENLLSSHLVTFSTPKLQTTDHPLSTFTFGPAEGKPRFLITGIPSFPSFFLTFFPFFPSFPPSFCSLSWHSTIKHAKKAASGNARSYFSFSSLSPPSFLLLFSSFLYPLFCVCHTLVPSCLPPSPFSLLVYPP